MAIAKGVGALTKARALPGDDALEALMAAIGRSAAFRLAQAFGGTRLYIPRTIGDHHPICVALGRGDADRLADYSGGSSMDIPKRAARRERVRQLLSGRSLTIAQVALETSYSERHIYRLQREQEDSRQPGLFDEI